MTVANRWALILVTSVLLAGFIFLSARGATPAPKITFPDKVSLERGEPVNPDSWWEIPISHPRRDDVRCTSTGLPPGIEIDEDSHYCAFYGRGQRQGRYSSVITASVGGQKTRHSIQWNITGPVAIPQGGGPVFTDPSQKQLRFVVGETVSWLVIDVSDGTAGEIRCRAKGLPKGLDFDQGASFCAIYGQVGAAPGQYQAQISATNTSQQVNTLTIDIQVGGMPTQSRRQHETHPDLWFNQSIVGAPQHPDSDSMIDTLTELGGFGMGRLQIDFSIIVNHAGSEPEWLNITAHPDGYYAPDCEPLGSRLPVPGNALVEGRKTVDRCDHRDEDCHLIVWTDDTLYEVFQARKTSQGAIEGWCLAKWDLSRPLPEDNRGEHCTSADAAGWPIAPLLFNADEVAAAIAKDNGDLGHAIRFILPNNRMASDYRLGGVGGRLYVRPASHAGAPSGPRSSVPYGSRLRLRSDFPETGYNPAAQVLIRTMKRYGIALADGGSIALTAENDVFTDTKWQDLSLGSRVFSDTRSAKAIAASDFEVIDTGERIAETFNCRRNPSAP